MLILIRGNDSILVFLFPRSDNGTQGQRKNTTVLIREQRSTNQREADITTGWRKFPNMVVSLVKSSFIVFRSEIRLKSVL